jgi:hypothetical protein
MLFGLGDEPKHGGERPRQDPRLAAGETVKRGDPTGEAYINRICPMQKFEKRGGKYLRARR